jgi:hypothetical protein
MRVLRLHRSPGTVTTRSNDKGALVTIASVTSVTSLFQIDPLRVFVDVPQPACPAITARQALDYHSPITYERIQHQTKNLTASPTPSAETG